RPVLYGRYLVAAMCREGDPPYAPHETELWAREDVDAFLRKVLVFPEGDPAQTFMQGEGDVGLARPNGTIVYLTRIEQNPINIKRYSFDAARRAVILRKCADDLDLAADRRLACTPAEHNEQCDAAASAGHTVANEFEGMTDEK